MLEQISRSDIADLRAVLTDAHYTERHLAEAIGTAVPPAAANLPVVLHRSRRPTALNALVRLFLIGTSLDRDAIGAVLPGPFIDMGLHSGLLESSGGRIHANIVVVPIGTLLFASDAFRRIGENAPGDFVLPASTRAASHLRHVTIRDPIRSALDLGCGCGVHALLAANHSTEVIATDISASAVGYTRLNALLNNIDNVTCFRGDTFGPVTGKKFDLIVSNPPFIVGPADEFTCRDNPFELDDYCRRLVQESPAFLNENGILQMLCEWVEIEEQPWQERLADWVRDLPCDTWILRSPPRDPASYVTQRMTDMTGEDVESGATFDDWLAYFEQRDVRAVHPGTILLRRRSGKNWIRVHALAAEPASDIGAAVRNNIAANDFLVLCEDDDVLLEAVLSLSPKLELEQTYTRDGGSWAEETATLRLTDGLPMTTEVDLAVLAFLNRLDGQKPLRDCIGAFCTITGADSAMLTPQLLPALRMFIANGFIEGVDIDD